MLKNLALENAGYDTTTGLRFESYLAAPGFKSIGDCRSPVLAIGHSLCQVAGPADERFKPSLTMLMYLKRIPGSNNQLKL